MRSTLALYCLLFSLISCVKPFDFKTEDADPIVVVEATITDELITQEVHLSYSRSVNTEESNSITNANVYIESGGGDRYLFNETDSGYYSDIEFAAQVGETYKLFVNTNTTQYQSSWQGALEAPEIENVYLRYIERPSETLKRNEEGMQVFIDAAQSSTEFFRVTWDETYEVRVPFPSGLDYLGPGNWIAREEQVGTCYNSDHSKEIITGTSTSNASARLIELPVRYISFETDMLRNKYSIEVTLYAIDRETHEFYKSLKEVNQSGGSLFDTQQGAVLGNVNAVGDESEVVLGYFEVASVKKKRVFFTWDELDVPASRPSYRYSCTANEIIDTTPDRIDGLMNSSRRLITVGTMPPTASIGPAECTDCTSFSSSQKPDFWQ